MKKLGMKKVWVPVIALCSVGLIVGTGYAAWTISRKQNGNATGNRKADAVTDAHAIVKNVKWYRGTGESKQALSEEDPNPTVCFGWTEKSGVSGDWLTNTNEKCKEDRKFTLAFDVEKGKDAGTVTPAVTRNVVDKALDSGTAFANCISNNLIKAPGDKKQGDDVLNYTLKAKAGTANGNTTPYTVDVSFSWGDHFENKNPMNFYNQFVDSEAWATYINAHKSEKYDASMYTDFSNSLGAIATLNTSSADSKTPRFDITIDVEGSN